jgi:hypothetical protein
LPTSRSSAAIRASYLLKQIGGCRIFLELASFVLLNPDPDQVSVSVIALGEPVKRLAGQELLSDLALELDAVGAVLGHGLPFFRKPGPTVNSLSPSSVEPVRARS